MILVILESPGKVAKVASFLGSGYVVKASMGHIRDLDPKKMSIDFDNHFEPQYVITKPDVVKNLKAAAKGVDMVYLATDDDNEGAQIAKSLLEVLKPAHYKRLLFNSISKEAILGSIKTATDLDENKVNAQKARRVIDRIFGYFISPLISKKIGGSLSAGRVQSPVVRLIVEKENDIKQFLKSNQDSTYFKVTGYFEKLKATLYESLDDEPWLATDALKGKIAHIPLIDGPEPKAKVITFLKRCLKSQFVVHSVTERTATRSPAPPFTTSTLQQEANRKFGMSVDTTMRVAQKLYEGGYITYMRTDSVQLSKESHKEIKEVIVEDFGEEYYQYKQYQTKSESAQEAHEAIRPVHPEVHHLDGEVDDEFQKKLYKLIWQRTIASQMKPAKINVTTIQITISKFVKEEIEPFYYFVSQIERVVFAGFMKVYVESVDDEEENGTVKNYTGKLPKEGDIVKMDNIIAKQEFLKPPSRYSEASLVKKNGRVGYWQTSHLC